MLINNVVIQGIFVAVMGLVLSACGGGGGGGGDESTPACCFDNGAYKQLFNDSALSTSSLDVYEITYGTGNTALKLLFESNADAILLHAIRGNFEVSGIKITQLLFDDPLVILDNSNNVYDPTKASASLTYSGVPITTDVDINYTKSEAAQTYSGFGDGLLPTIAITLDTRVQYDRMILGNDVDIDETLHTELLLVKGIGIVSHIGNYVGLSFDAQIQALDDLPEPIWFDRNAGNPIQISGNTFVTSAGNISSDDYEIANMDEINALGWISVQEDTSSNTFNVTVQNDPNLPASGDLPVSVEVVFEHTTSNERMSGNVTLVD
jgi:hypothetical protein